MGLQYLEALKALGDSPSTKYVLPMELVQLAQGFAATATGAFGSSVTVDGNGATQSAS
jgi:hypothetical protein